MNKTREEIELTEAKKAFPVHSSSRLLTHTAPTVRLFGQEESGVFLASRISALLNFRGAYLKRLPKSMKIHKAKIVAVNFPSRAAVTNERDEDCCANAKRRLSLPG
jgi:hypothetical protein